MGLEALLAELDADAAAEREAVLAEARERADRIFAESERSLSRRRGERLDAARAEEERTALADTSDARSDARRLVLDARRRIAERVRAEVERAIVSSASHPAYPPRLAHELRSAARLAPPGPFELRVAPELVAHVDDVMPRVEGTVGRGRSAEVEITPDPDLVAGFLLVAEKGRVVIDGTLGARLRLAWPRIAPRVLGELES